MARTPDKSLPAGTQGLRATTEHALKPEFLHLLLWLQNEQNSGHIDPSPSSSVAWHAPTARPEGQISTTGSEHDVCCEKRSRASARCFDGQGPLSSTSSFEQVGLIESLNDSTPFIERVGRFESLNDVTGRALRVFRKSPCPPRRKVSFSPASDSE